MVKASSAGEGKKRKGRQPLPTVVDPETGQEVKVRPERHPIPDGWLLPTDFHLYVTHYGVSSVSIPTIYSWINGITEREVSVKGGGTRVIPANGFPCEIHSDGRTIIDRDKAIEWIASYNEAKQNKAQSKAQRMVSSSTRLRSNAARLNLILGRMAATMRTATNTETLTENHVG
jgi:hypothetical protein